jgi:hypothetical protein
MCVLYFFGSDKCEKCKQLLIDIHSLGILDSPKMELKFIDAFAEENQDFCDEHEVDELPHVQIYDSHNNLIFEKIGMFDPKNILEEIVL